MDKAFRIENGIDNSSEKEIIWVSILDALASQKSTDKAVKILEDKKNCIVNKYGKTFAFVVVAKALRENNDEKKAEEMLSEGLDFANSIKDDYSKANALLEVVRIWRKENTKLNISNVLQTVLNLCRKMADEHKVTLFETIAEVLTLLTDRSLITNMARTILPEIQKLDDKIDKENVLMNIARALVKIGEDQKALDVVDINMYKDGKYSYYKRRDLKEAVLSEVVQTYVEEGKLDRAKSISKVPNRDHARSRLIKAVTENLASLGEFNKSSELAKMLFLNRDEGKPLRGFFSILKNMSYALIDAAMLDKKVNIDRNFVEEVHGAEHDICVDSDASLSTTNKVDALAASSVVSIISNEDKK